MPNVNNRPTVTTQHIIQGAGKVTVDGVEVGGFQGGVKIAYNQKEAFISSECSLGEIDSEITGTEFSINTELEEATLEAMAWAMFGINSSSVTSATSSKTLRIIPPQSMEQHVVVFEGMSAENRVLTRTFTCNKVVKVGNSGQTLKRAEKTVIPVSLKALQGTDNSYGTIVDRTIG